ncbi:MAG: hypothetical protein H0W62_14930 [Chitinophagales bacterium]|nr:hypothetical protein [Chitinophagales bacterium]
MNALVFGTTYNALTIVNLKKVLITLPPFEEQAKKVAEI